jgi:tetratricopeptide (TPR) repeat protein
MTETEVLEFVKRHGVVLMSARGPAPSLAEAIVGGPIRGSWWAHPKSHAIFRLLGVACDSPDVLVCRLVNGKVTLVHRRLWPALVRLSRRLPKGALAAVREEHTPSGRHRTVETPFPRWVPEAIKEEAKGLNETEAVSALGGWLVPGRSARARPRGRGPVALVAALSGLLAAAPLLGLEAPAPAPGPTAAAAPPGQGAAATPPGQGAAAPPPEGEDESSKLHEPRELFDLMERSSIVYELDLDDSLPAPAGDPARVLPNQLVLKKKGGGTTLTAYELSSEANEILGKAEKAFEEKDYDRAMALYEKLRAIAPDYHHALTLIGDVHFARGDYEKAVACKEWDYAPRYSLSREGGKVKVRFAEEWMGYAIAKAIWKYEPGYAESMEGPDYQERTISMLEEKEALLGALATNKKLTSVSQAIEDGYVDEFIVYEVLARKSPGALVLLPPDYFDRLLRYVDTYH